MEKEYVFKNLGVGKTIVRIENNKLTIKRKGIRSALNYGLKGEKTIMINQISAVQFKKSGMAAGYIQFIIPGSQENKCGLMDALKDENTVTFNMNEKVANANAQEIKEYIENFNSGNSVAPVAEEDKYDKLKKLKELLDDGIIDEKEFKEEKEKLLK